MFSMQGCVVLQPQVSEFFKRHGGVSRCQAASWKSHRVACDAFVREISQRAFASFGGDSPKEEAGPERPPTLDGGDAPLETFTRVEPKCGSCGFAAPANQVWTRYRACCGKRTCADCERKLTGDAGEPDTGAASLGHGKKKTKEELETRKRASRDPCLFCGEVVEDALARVRERAEAKNEDARYVLGVSMMQGYRECERHPKLACKWLQLAARSGHFAALYELAVAHSQGLTGRVADPAKAARMYRRAAAQGGQVRALYALALAYHRGEGVEADKREAIRLLNLAADAGFYDARKALARFFADGDEVEQDREKAARLLGLDRTADLIKKGINPPSFLFRETPEEERAFVKNEYTEAEMDDFFGDEDGDYDDVRT
ncbi:hypothetical protein CTAYLR_005250, partial [Chrysophaeum taylorii]